MHAANQPDDLFGDVFYKGKLLVIIASESQIDKGRVLYKKEH
jgi:hypothetical protein